MVARIKKKIPASKAMTHQRRSMLNHPNRQKVIFKKGNKVSVGNQGRRHKRYLTMSLIRELEEEVEVRRTKVMKSGKRVDKIELISKQQALMEAIYKAAVVDRNATVMKFIFETIEGKTPQEIDVRTKSYNLNSNMSLAEMSKLYLESIKRTAIDDDDEEEDE